MQGLLKHAVGSKTPPEGGALSLLRHKV